MPRYSSSNSPPSPSSALKPFSGAGRGKDELLQSLRNLHSGAEDDPQVLEALANEYMQAQSLDYYSSVYGMKLSKEPVDVPRQEQIEFDDDYFTTLEKAKYEYPKPLPRSGERRSLQFTWQQGGLLGRGSYGCVCIARVSLYHAFSVLFFTCFGAIGHGLCVLESIL